MSLTFVVTALKAEFRVLQGSWDVSPEQAAEILWSLGFGGREAVVPPRGGPERLRSWAVRGALRRPVCLRPHRRQAGSDLGLDPRDVGRSPRGFKQRSDGVRKVFFFPNCELYRVRALLPLVGKSGQRAVLACGVGEPGSR